MRPRVAPRLLAALAVASSGLLASMLAAGPALASPAPPTVTTGPGGSGGGSTSCAGLTCAANVWSYVQLSGATGAGMVPSGQSYVSLPPPPCYMEPMFSGPLFYSLWDQGSHQRVGPNGINPEQVYAPWVPQIKAHKADNSGYWYVRVTNTFVPGTCSLPMIAWVPNGTPPPLPHVPLADLANYAYDHMTLPSPVLTLNPRHRSIVSLPTYVWASLGGGMNPLTAGGNTTLTATATLGNESATVSASAGGLSLGTSVPGSLVYSNCGPTGSRSRPVGTAPPNAGPGTTPDCGVVFTTATTSGTVTGSLQWNITSNYGRYNPILVQGSAPVSVAEIQGLNG
jgi:hypothetical protein